MSSIGRIVLKSRALSARSMPLALRPLVMPVSPSVASYTVHHIRPPLFTPVAISQPLIQCFSSSDQNNDIVKDDDGDEDDEKDDEEGEERKLCNHV